MTTQTQKKLIPKFSTPTEQTREVDGQPVKVRRLPAELAPDVLARLLGDVGSTVAEMISSPDVELDPQIESAVRGMIANKMGTGTGVATSVVLLKALVFSNAVSKVAVFDFGWYVRQMLPGRIEIGGVPIDTMAELDETGIMPLVLFELFKFACEVNFFPTFAGRGTSPGSVLSAEAERPQPVASRTTGKSSLTGDKKKDGRPDRTSATAR